MKTTYITGVDIGGSHITAGLVNSTTRTVVSDSLVRRPVDPHATANEIISAWGDAIRQVAASAEATPYQVGIAMPGPFDYEKGIARIRGFNKYESLYGHNVKEMLAQYLGIEAAGIQLKNDAAAFLQGEVVGGAAVGYEKAVGITLGTGLGSARTKNGDTEEGALNISPLHEGIAEDYISIRWFLKRYHELTGREAENVQALAAKAGQDEQAARVFREFAANLAIVLQRFIAVEQPAVVVVGGGIANAFDLFYPPLSEKLQDAIGDTVIKQSLLGEQAAMIGAASAFGEKAGIIPSLL